MYQAIQMSVGEDKLFTEAVFSGGKEKLKPIVEDIRQLKEKLLSELQKQDKSVAKASESDKKKPSVKAFNPTSFWKDTLWKKLEDDLRKVFGFRYVSINPFIERYDSKKKEFESHMMNCMIYHTDRFPVDGLVTDNGFYDKTHSLTMEIHISLAIMRDMSPEEIMAVLLHEFGHGIDPALVDIRYAETNILSKYLTDRKKEITKAEQKVVKKRGFFEIFIAYLVIFGIFTIAGIISRIKQIFRDKFTSKKAKQKREDDQIKKLQNMIDKDKSTFSRQNFSEAYADNFARMYGYGAYLGSALNKMDHDVDKQIKSRFKKESERRECIISFAKDALNDEHRTSLHRIRALIKEYENDINDPNTPNEVKKQLKDDVNELHKLMDEYTNNFSALQNRINKMIFEELEKVDGPLYKPEEEKPDEEIKEGVTFFEKKKWEIAMEKRKKAEESVTAEDRKLIHERFGHSTACSFGRDEDGIYCFTHRCRSKSYPSVDKIPQSKYDFVCSTS